MKVVIQTRCKEVSKSVAQMKTSLILLRMRNLLRTAHKRPRRPQ